MPEIKRINPRSLKQPTKSYSNGVLVPLGNANLMFVTGQVAKDLEGNVVSPGNAEAQAQFIFSRISDILAEAGMTLDDVIKIQIFVTSMDDSPKVSAVRDIVLKNSKPASTLAVVSGLVTQGCCVEIEAIATQLH